METKNPDTKNTDHRLRAKWHFGVMFVVTLLIITGCGVISIITAQKGMLLLESKKAEYDDVFKKQAELNFQMDELFRNLNNLKTKQRSTNEHKHMQQIITKMRLLMENDLNRISTERAEYGIYKVLLEQVKDIQVVMDELDREIRKREYNIEQLEKCRAKYQELTRINNNRP